MTASALEAMEFAVNAEPRIACVLLLDTSGSMNGDGKLKKMNDALLRFRDGLVSDPIAARRVEIAVISFNNRANVLSNFTTVDKFQPPTLVATGETMMGAAVICGLDLVEARKAEYKNNAISYYRPWVVLFTDGDASDPDTIVEAAARVKAAEEAKKVAFFAFGVGVEADKDTLRLLSQRRFASDTVNFAQLFDWLTASLLQASTSRVGDQIIVPEVPADRIL